MKSVQMTWTSRSFKTLDQAPLGPMWNECYITFFFQIFTFKLYLVIFLSWTLFVVIIFVIVFGPSAVARAALWNRVCPPLCLSRCLCGIGWLVFSEFWHGVRNPYEFVGDRIRLFEKTFHHIWGKLAKNGLKIGFSGFIE